MKKTKHIWTCDVCETTIEVAFAIRPSNWINVQYEHISRVGHDTGIEVKKEVCSTACLGKLARSIAGENAHKKGTKQVKRGGK